MQIGKLNITEWTYNNVKLARPYIIIWKLLWIIPVYTALIIFAAIMVIFDLDIDTFGEIIKNNR